MSPEDDENYPVWSDASSTTNWQRSVDVEEPSLVPVSDMDDIDLLDSEDDLSNWASPPLVGQETPEPFWRRFSPILIPLPFAILVFLFTLPTTLQRSPNHAPLFIVALVLCSVALLQGVLLYFVGANDTLWMLYVACGYALFIVIGIFVGFGMGAALITLFLLVCAGIFLAQRGIRPTTEGYVDIIESFGKYTHTLYPGLNFLMPWEKVARRLSTRETTWTCSPQRVPTSRDQDVQLIATISYQLLPEDAYLAVVTTQNWEQNLQLLFVGTIQSVVNELTPSDFISWSQSIYTRAANDSSSFNPAAVTRWDRINSTLRRRMEDQTATWGVKVNWVRIQDITILPHTPDHIHSSKAEENFPVTLPKAPVPAAPRPILSDAPTTVMDLSQLSGPVIEKSVVEPVRVSTSPPSPTEKTVEKAMAGKPINIETLVEAYNAVRQNSITDPTTILGIARRFDDLANDPINSKKIDFDAARAASTLRSRVQKLQSLTATQSSSRPSDL